MDPLIIVALVSGAFGTIGSFLKIAEKVAESKGNRPKLELDREAQIDANLWKYIDELKVDREKAEERETRAQEAFQIVSTTLGHLRTDYTALQGLYQQNLIRIESLEQGREKDQTQILNLQAKIRQLEAASE